jgi:hypothetical protein
MKLYIEGGLKKLQKQNLYCKKKQCGNTEGSCGTAGWQA